MIFLYAYLGGIVSLTGAAIGGAKIQGTLNVPFYGIVLAILLWPIILPIMLLNDG